MSEISLNRHVLVQRHLVVLVVGPALCCITLFAYGAVTISDFEYTRAVGVSDNVYPFAITAQYRSAYNWWWSGPVAAGIWALVLVSRRCCSLITVICYIQSAIVFVSVWTVFMACAFYLENQTFWGWRRVIVGNQVYAEKSLQPGQGALVSGGDDLLPGELYDGRWGTPGAISVLRNVAGTSEEKKSDRKHKAQGTNLQAEQRIHRKDEP